MYRSLVFIAAIIALVARISLDVSASPRHELICVVGFHADKTLLRLWAFAPATPRTGIDATVGRGSPAYRAIVAVDPDVQSVFAPQNLYARPYAHGYYPRPVPAFIVIATAKAFRGTVYWRVTSATPAKSVGCNIPELQRVQDEDA